MPTKKVLTAVEKERALQVAAICSAFGDMPLPRGISVDGIETALHAIWQSGFDTGYQEIHDETQFDINQQQRLQCIASMEALGLESEREAELVLHCWRAGLLTCRDWHGIKTPAHPTQRKVMKVRIDKNGN